MPPCYPASSQANAITTQASPRDRRSAWGWFSRPPITECREGSSPASAAIQDVRVDHRRGAIAMVQQFLDRADVVAAFEKMCGKRAAQRAWCRVLDQSGLARRLLHRSESASRKSPSRQKRGSRLRRPSRYPSSEPSRQRRSYPCRKAEPAPRPSSRQCCFRTAASKRVAEHRTSLRAAP